MIFLLKYMKAFSIKNIILTLLDIRLMKAVNKQPIQKYHDYYGFNAINLDASQGHNSQSKSSNSRSVNTTGRN